METGKRLRSISEEKTTTDRVRKSYPSQERRNKDIKDNLQSKGRNNKPSLIPVPKGEKIEPKSVQQKQRKCYSSSKLCCVSLAKPNKRCEDFDAKLKLLEEKEKSIAQYYVKVEDLIRKLTETEETENGKPLKRKPSRIKEARKMTSEPKLSSKTKTSSDILSELESNVQQISKIWLQASSDLSSTLKHLKSNPALDPMEFELEKVRLQLAIKQTRSLTLIKTRDILVEAKKLFRHREMIRTELENIVNYEKSKSDKWGCFKEEISVEEKDTSTSLEGDNKQNVGGTGDTPKEESDLDSQVVNTNTTDSESQQYCQKKRSETSETEEESSAQSTNNLDVSSSKEKAKMSGENSNKQQKSIACKESSKSIELETWTREVAKKNETIGNLNNKIFELQKICNEQSQKCAQFQVALSAFNDKIQWNHVLWKQIGKLKEQIKGLQQSNKHLESQKRELECKITRLDSELERLSKLNHFLNQRKYLLTAQESFERGCQCMDYRRGEESCRYKSDKCEMEKTAKEIILSEKQNAINQLKTIVNVMRDQENFAQKQITLFQNKIEELERNTKS